MLLAANQPCTVTIGTLNVVSGGTYVANFSLNDSKGNTIVVVPLNSASPAPAPAPIGSGGCTMVAGGDDYSMLFMLSGLSMLFFVRRRKTTK